MDLIQNSVSHREGKKWKTRWAVLKKASPKSARGSKDVYYYLFLYKDASHATERKEKYVVPLVDFCGFNSCKEYDKVGNVLIVITTSQTVYLSFNQISLRDQWKAILADHFGEAVSYDISIPDKQKLKPGQATIRLYPSFFSIVTNKNLKCLNRWFINDIHHYSAVDDSHFMFEIAPPMRAKGLVVNLLVPKNADDVAKAFDYIMSQLRSHDSSSLVHADFHGSALLDELDQAKRNVGDQSFFRRVILRASDRMRKKKRERAHSGGAAKKKNNLPGHNSMSEEAKFRSLDRKKTQDLSVNLDEDSMLKTMQMVRNQSVQSPEGSTAPQSPVEEPPELPKKKCSNHSATSVAMSVPAQNDKLNDGAKHWNDGVKHFMKPRSMTTNDIPNVFSLDKPKASRSAEIISDRGTLSRESSDHSISDKYMNGKTENNMNVQVCPTDKSDISNRYPRRSVDNHINSSYKHPAKYAIAKTTRANSKSKSDNQKTPTPPPRSPVSLGIQPNVFDFSSENVGDSKDGSENRNSLLNEIDMEVKRRTVHSEDLSDDAFTYGGEPSPSPTPSNNNNNNLMNRSTEPIYGNMPTVRNASDSGSNMLSVDAIRRRNCRRNSTKHLSDPLVIDQWVAATGDGVVTSSLRNLPSNGTDYINVKGNQSDDDNDSYVNVTQDDGKRKKNKPKPLRLKSYRNEFEKYDDEDSRIYHAVGALDDDSSRSSDNVTYFNQSDGSYENVNATKPSNRTKSDYLNLMSPAKSKQNTSRLNYVVVGRHDMFPGSYNSKSTSTSPVRQTPRSPVEVYNKSNYTWIDEDATGALNRSMQEHRQQRDRLATNKTPTKTPK